MRTVKAAKKELKYLKSILEEFVQDYDYAQNEEDLSTDLHNRYSLRIAEVHRRYKEIEGRLRGLKLI